MESSEIYLGYIHFFWLLSTPCAIVAGDIWGLQAEEVKWYRQEAAETKTVSIPLNFKVDSKKCPVSEGSRQFY